MAAALRPAVGVDVVRVERFARAVSHGLLARVCAPPELQHLHAGRWPVLPGCSGPEPALAAAATWAVKEAAIKIVGGRPPGFDWRSVRVRHHEVPAALEEPWQRMLQELLTASLEDGLAARPAGICTYHWTRPRAFPGGIAAWTWRDGLVSAVAISTPAGTAAE